MSVYIRELSRALSRRNAWVDIFTLCHQGAEEEVQSIGEGVRLVHLPLEGAAGARKEDLFSYLPQFVSAVQDHVERHGIAYDILHSHYWLSALAGERLKASLKIPHVVTFHTLARVKELADPAHPEPCVRKRAEEATSRAADLTIAFTEEERDNLGALYGVEEGRIRVVPAGLDSTLFSPVDMAQARSRLGLRTAKVLLFAGRLDPIKGVDTLLRAFALMDKDAALIVLGGSSGEGDELARLKALASDLGIAGRVEFRPPVPQWELPYYYSAATATVVPSRHESFGLVAVESLACGTPVVASNRGGLRTTVRDGENGLLVYDLSPEGFAARLTELLGDEVLERRLRSRARESVRGYSWEAVGEAVLAEYETLVSCASAPAGVAGQSTCDGSARICGNPRRIE